MNDCVIYTKRLILKKLEIQYKNEIYNYRSDIAIRKYQPFEPEYIEDVESFILDNTIKFNVENTWFQLGIINSGQIIGDIGIHFIGPNNLQCGIGYTIAKQYQRQGYGIEAVTGVINFLFTDLQKHRLTASVDPENFASIKLLEKIGFRREAYFRKSILVENEWKDDVVYGLLKEEWDKIKKI